MDGLQSSLQRIKSERPGLVKCLASTFYVLSAVLLGVCVANPTLAATDAVSGITTPDINARSYGSKINRRSASGRVYLLDVLDGAQELPPTGRLILLRQGETPVMAFRVLKQYPDRREYAAKWLRRYSGTKELEAGSQYITLEKVSDKESPPLTTQDKKDLKELEAQAPAPIAPVPPVEAAAPVAPVPPPAAAVAPIPQPVAKVPAPEAVAVPPEPPTAPLPVPPPVAAAPAPVPPAPLAVPPPVAAPAVEPVTPVVMASPETPAAETTPPAVANQDVVAPPMAPEAPVPAPEAAAPPMPAPADTSIPPPAAAVAENDNIPAPAAAPKPEVVPDTEGETAEVSANSGDDLSSIMVEDLKLFDRDENSIGLGAGLYRNTLVSGGDGKTASTYNTTTVYNSGGTLRYSRTLKHMLHYKSKALQDSFSLDASMGFYKYLGQSGNGDSYTILPLSLTARYTLLPSEGFGIFIYGGFVKNVVAQVVNADSFTQAGFNSFFPEVGVGMQFQIGPSWYMRADLGLDLLGVSIALRF